jgi:hypothetical protein
MFNRAKISDIFKGLVGFRQPFNLDYQKISLANQTSESDLYLDDLPFCKVEYFVDTQDTLVDSELNTILENIKKASAVTLMSKLFLKNDIIDNQRLFTKKTNKNTIISQSNGLKGFSIEQSNKQNIGFKINSITLEFSGAGNIEIFLKHSQSDAIIESKIITIASEYQVEELGWYIENTIHYKGEYYIGYIYDGSLQAFERTNSYQNNVSELCVKQIEQVDLTDIAIADNEFFVNTSISNGLNLDISVFYDYTRWITLNKMMFAKAFQLECSINILNRFISSSRSNILERYSKDIYSLILIEINGYESNGRTKKGLQSLLLEELNILQKEINKYSDTSNMPFVQTLC